MQPPEVFCKKAVLSLWHRCLPVNFAKFLRIPLLQNKSRWLLPDQNDISCKLIEKDIRLSAKSPGLPYG